MILVSSNSCFKFATPRIAPCNAANSDYILKRVCDFHIVVYLQIHSLARENYELEI